MAFGSCSVSLTLVAEMYTTLLITNTIFWSGKCVFEMNITYSPILRGHVNGTLMLIQWLPCAKPVQTMPHRHSLASNVITACSRNINSVNVDPNTVYNPWSNFLILVHFQYSFDTSLWKCTRSQPQFLFCPNTGSQRCISREGTEWPKSSCHWGENPH